MVSLYGDLSQSNNLSKIKLPSQPTCITYINFSLLLSWPLLPWPLVPHKITTVLGLFMGIDRDMVKILRELLLNLQVCFKNLQFE